MTTSFVHILGTYQWIFTELCLRYISGTYQWIFHICKYFLIFQGHISLWKLYVHFIVWTFQDHVSLWIFYGYFICDYPRIFPNISLWIFLTHVSLQIYFFQNICEYFGNMFICACGIIYSRLHQLGVNISSMYDLDSAHIQICLVKSLLPFLLYPQLSAGTAQAFTVASNCYSKICFQGTI